MNSSLSRPLTINVYFTLTVDGKDAFVKLLPATSSQLTQLQLIPNRHDSLLVNREDWPVLGINKGAESDTIDDDMIIESMVIVSERLYLYKGADVSIICRSRKTMDNTPADIPRSDWQQIPLN